MIRMCDIKNKIKVKPSEITFICLLTFTIAEEQIMKLLQKLDMHWIDPRPSMIDEMYNNV